jgi:hypothetical protein
MKDVDKFFAQHRERLTQSFLQRVSLNALTGCWDWTGGQAPRGYGSMSLTHTDRVLAHRASAYLYKGLTDESGLLVLHKCDRKCCVNPEHLFLGTAQDNTDDMHRKGRARKARGERTGNAVLTDRMVRDIRRRWAQGERQCDIARALTIAKDCVYQIVHNKRWQHVR